MVLFLLFPENFERIFSKEDRKKIVNEFTKEPVGAGDGLKDFQYTATSRRRTRL